jgi:AraC-like DNA-binding protein
VVAYYFLYQNASGLSGQEFALSDGNPGISFSLADAYSFTMGAAKEVCTADAFICGAFTKGIYVKKGERAQQMFGVKFTVDGLYFLLKEPVSALSHKPVWLVDAVLGNSSVILTEQIRQVPGVQQKIQVLETYIRKNLSLRKPVDLLFRQAVKYIKQSGGQARIEQVATQVNIGYKGLERKFIAYTGLTPKEFARLIRFVHTYFDYKRQGPADLLDIAIRNGYYDHTHFNKDFKQYTSYSPTQLLQAPVYDLASIMEPIHKRAN